MAWRRETRLRVLALFIAALFLGGLFFALLGGSE